MAVYSSPFPSPDGKRLAFIFRSRAFLSDSRAGRRRVLVSRGRILDLALGAHSKMAIAHLQPCPACKFPRVLIVDENSNRRREIPVPAFQLSWAGANRLVALLTDDDFLRVLGPPRYKPRVAFTTGRFRLLDPAVAPNGDDVAVTALDMESRASIVLLSLSRRTFVRRLTSGPSDRQPSWSPSGRRLVFVRGKTLVTVTRFGRDLRRLPVSGALMGRRAELAKPAPVPVVHD